MLPSPTSSPRAILEDRLNVEVTPPRKRKSSLPTPPKSGAIASRKRPAKKPVQEKSRKKAKTCETVEEATEDETEEEDSALFEESDEDEPLLPSRARRRTVFHAQSSFVSTSANTYRGLDISTRPVLESFVSSLKSDVYTCQSLHANSFLTPPYACAYSHAAKSGGVPLLAVATEEGTVQIINTSKRKPWDPEPVRNILQPHENGIFDVKWDRTNSHIVTCSGDQSSRITSVEKNVVTHVLHGHTSTVKTASWDPTNDALLATGGRDGTICLWDLRTSTSSSTTNGAPVLEPVVVILNAHGSPTAPKPKTEAKPKARNAKKLTSVPMPKTVTSLLYPESQSYGLVSSSASDGILRFWDLRKPATPQRSRSTKSKLPTVLYSTTLDPTTLNGSKRPRGITSLVQGFGPTSGLVFGLGHDSKIHTYSLPTLTAQPACFSEDSMQTSSFYVGLSLSPCGNWLACGASNPRSSSFLFEVSGAGKVGANVQAQRAVELRGQNGEMGAVDWADNCLATCADDGTVRVWRPDVEAHRQCMDNPDEARWDWCWSRQIV
ncbi:hypothetical protein D9756_000821 [Leucocoprinus leucothites]|uniref:WD40 repeat-like protein n=1 Tax=Leucocoprinus leucothites TaxID=201217 RepID=A0A8H5GFF4_9AGAR|nr:hypothetical protein D9756_000821 [Leucoagaricus leucothites]